MGGMNLPASSLFFIKGGKNNIYIYIYIYIYSLKRLLKLIMFECSGLQKFEQSKT